jgi:hypothetical protein
MRSELSRAFGLLADLRRGLDSAEWQAAHGFPRVSAEHRELLRLLAGELVEALDDLAPEAVAIPSEES